ncbi:helix-turn-helix domain-containing protein [Streptomyces sp. NPDC004111]|uniref:helix-turn-helix domain-containing protein n=1 Tax=Streptomyces sp. NPDC004111 TaxID=3364690 RepID=UPI0036A3F2BF
MRDDPAPRPAATIPARGEASAAHGGAHSAAFVTGIGGRIRELRAERGLTLSELALRAGIGKATLSGLEAGTRNPTLETLYAVAGRLGVPLAALLTGGPREPMHGDSVTGELLEVFADPAATTELYRLRIRPGRRQTSPAHPPGTTEYLTVYEGVARVGPKDAAFLVAAGEHVSWVADVPHVYEATGDVEVLASLVIRY